MPVARPLARIAALLLGLSAAAAGLQAQTTRVSNTATLIWGETGAERTVRSNTVVLDVAVTKGPTKLGFRLPPPGYQIGIPKCRIDALPVTEAFPIDAATLASTTPLAVLDVDQPRIVVLEAPLENHDPTTREMVRLDVQVDGGGVARQLELTETGADTGVFAGGLPAATTTVNPSPCNPLLKRGQRLRLNFTGSDASMPSTASVLVDPAGYMFDSTTGALVDGAVVTLLDDTGQPATVYGDDGVSLYPSTITVGQNVVDASGRVYPPATGRYRFPFVVPGGHLLRIVPPPGYSAPSMVAPTVLATLPAPRGTPYIINEASFLRAFVVTADRDFIADVPLDPRAMLGVETANLLSKVASVRDASPGDPIQYVLRLTNRGAAIARDVAIHDVLPPGLRYIRGSARGGAEPVIAGDGRTLDFALPALAVGATAELRYVATVTPDAPVGEALNRAQATVNGIATSNAAAASVRLRALLFTDAMTILGRVTEGYCGDPNRARKGVPGIRLMLEDGTFVVTDRDGLYHLEGIRPGRHVVQIDTGSIPATHAPVAFDKDTRQAGSAISRFVEGQGGLIKRVDFQLRPTGHAAVADAALPVAVVDDATAAGNRDWLAGQAAGVDWLFPAVDHNPRAPALRVVIKHRPGQRVELAINGKPVDALAFDATDVDHTSGVAVSRWTGIPLESGDNRLVARVLDRDGRVVATLERSVHRAGAPRRAVIDVARSRLLADGLTRPLIAVRVTDKDGRPVAAGVLVPFVVDQPYAAAIDAALQQGLQRAASSARVVGDDGLAFIALQPTTQAGAVRAVVSLAEDRNVRTSEIRAWLSAAQKQWTIVGFGAGSTGYDTLANRSRSLPRAQRNALNTDGQIAVYAKGRIRGSWLLTMAYDSDRRYDRDRGLLGTIDPDRYYTVYGDGSAQGYDAPTKRRLYVRLERREAYALFGDFETGFTETQLARYSRTLNGVKAAYEGRRMRAVAFAAKTDTRYARDEIQGNGLTGPYRLSARGIVPNTDKLRIEVRDRFRSDRIVSSQALARHIDYDIDVDLGTVRFRSPILSRDTALNPVFVVAEYEVEGTTGKLAAAARVAAKLGRVEIGASAIRDESAGHATIAAVDVRARIGTATEARAEFATGGLAGLGRDVAYLAEVEHHGAAADFTAYVRGQDAAFGVGQQNLVEAGTQKVGLDGTLRLTPRLSLTGTIWQQARLGAAGSRMAGDARLEYRRDTGTVFVGVQFASDRGLDGDDRQSRLLTLGGSQAVFGEKLVLTGQTQVAPDGADASVDFPIRHQLSAALRVVPGVRLIAGYEIADGKDFVAHTAQAGFDVSPWRGAKLSSTLNRQAAGENGERTFAQYGATQSLPLGTQWTLDATLDASTTIAGHIDRRAAVSAFQPVASGGYLGADGSDGAFAAMTLGAAYRADRWSWNARLERRASATTRRLGLTSAWLRTLGEGRTLASGIKAYRIDDRTGNAAVSATADIALAWRPIDSRWSILERFVLRHDRADRRFDDRNVLGIPALTGVGQTTDRAIQNLAINYRSGDEGAGHGFEATAYLGAKYVRGKFADEAFDGMIEVVGFELCRDVTARIDIGVQGSVQHAWRGGSVAFSTGPSVGVSPATNLWLTAGYNVSGFRDRDFEDARYTRSGPYVALRFKFDQLSVGGAARAMGIRR